MRIPDLIQNLSKYRKDIYIKNIESFVKYLVLLAKSNFGYTQLKLSERLNVDVTMINKWTNGIPISVKNIVKLAEICKRTEILEDISTSSISFSSRNGKLIKLPYVIDRELAYLLGLIIGDGCLTLNKNTVDISGSFEEVNGAARIIEQKFGVKPRLIDYKTYAVLTLSSVVIRGFLVCIFGLPEGKKKGKIRMPKIIYKSEKLIKLAFLKGFYESDGSYSIRDYGRETLSFKQSTLALLEDIKHILNEEHIKSGIYPDRTMNSWSLSIFNKREIKKLHKLINYPMRS